jgi:hypothetical protein
MPILRNSDFDKIFEFAMLQTVLDWQKISTKILAMTFSIF